MSIPSLASSTIRRLEGKVALITGGASGLGECTAGTFVRHGVKVLIADIKDELGKFVSNDIGPQFASFVHCDVTKEKDVESAVNTAISQHGKIDIMFNNADVIELPKLNILDNETSDFERVLNVNLVGAFLGTKHAARVMKPTHQGSINTIASICSTIGGIASYAYTSSKHGVYGIRVNCVYPYVVATPLAKDFFKLDDEGVHGIYANLKRAILESKDVTGTALYLGSDESKYLTILGATIQGGMPLRTLTQVVCHGPHQPVRTMTSSPTPTRAHYPQWYIASTPRVSSDTKCHGTHQPVRYCPLRPIGSHGFVH
ncbi:hypothetical protein CRYUN_Cryun25bG0077900 [Craigia yunnanensis]